MKEQRRTDQKKLSDVEEGLQQEKQECIKDLEYKIGYCKRWIWRVKLILYIQLALLVGWSCYMILLNYDFKTIGNDATDVARERYQAIFGSQFEAHPSTAIPAVKFEVNLNKFHKPAEDTDLIKQQVSRQDKRIAMDGIVHMDTQDLITARNDNAMRKSQDVNNLLSRILSRTYEDLMHDEEFTKRISRLWKIYWIGNIDGVIDTHENDASTGYEQFLKKLEDISDVKTISELEKLANKKDHLKNTHCIESNNREDHALDAPGKLESLENDITTISNPQDSVDYEISEMSSILTDILQNIKQELSDFTDDAVLDGQSGKTSISDESDEGANVILYPELMSSSPVSQLHKFFSAPSQHSKVRDSLASESSQENSKQSENKEFDILIDDVIVKNENKHGIDDSDVPILTFLDSDAFKNNHLYPLFGSRVLVQDTAALNTQHSFKITAKEDEKDESRGNVKGMLEVNPVLTTLPKDTEKILTVSDLISLLDSPAGGIENIDDLQDEQIYENV